MKFNIQQTELNTALQNLVRNTNTKFEQFSFNRLETKENNLISVFGSAGKRDVAKRKVFGEIAEKYCDYIILTAKISGHLKAIRYF